MSLSERYQAKLEAAVEPHLDGPMVFATIGSPVGSMSRLLRSEAFNVALAGAGDNLFRSSGRTTGRLHDGAGRDIRLPTSFIVALTPTSLFVFKYKSRWSRFKVKRELARIPRAGMVVQIHKGKASATVFQIASEATGDRMAFEMATLGMAYAKAKVEQVVQAFAPETR
jgi:hypothetical protein